jgi:hypothetical protein
MKTFNAENDCCEDTFPNRSIVELMGKCLVVNLNQ